MVRQRHAVAPHPAELATVGFNIHTDDEYAKQEGLRRSSPTA